ncbi:MAG: hypothetical protein RR942_01370 [Romboutsia sp.]
MIKNLNIKFIIENSKGEEYNVSLNKNCLIEVEAQTINIKLTKQDNITLIAALNELKKRQL